MISNILKGKVDSTKSFMLPETSATKTNRDPLDFTILKVGSLLAFIPLIGGFLVKNKFF